MYSLAFWFLVLFLILAFDPAFFTPLTVPSGISPNFRFPFSHPAGLWASLFLFSVSLLIIYRTPNSSFTLVVHDRLSQVICNLRNASSSWANYVLHKSGESDGGFTEIQPTLCWPSWVRFEERVLVLTGQGGTPHFFKGIKIFDSNRNQNQNQQNKSIY